MRALDASVFFPPLDLCTDNGAMIAVAGLARLQRAACGRNDGAFTVHPRWTLQQALA
jgi:N6-L-threonylcarbamoyladenine synthase